VGTNSLLNSIFFQFDRDGYAILENFLSEEEVQSVKEAGLALTRDIDNEQDRVVFNEAPGSDAKKVTKQVTSLARIW
jgi:Phytanoyl-CoA dioxygenase (PhyH).